MLEELGITPKEVDKKKADSFRDFRQASFLRMGGESSLLEYDEEKSGRRRKPVKNQNSDFVYDEQELKS